MNDRLQGKRVAILATDGFEQSELLEPRKALKEAGAETFVVSNKTGKINAWNKDSWGTSVPVDHILDECEPDDFECLLIPGGVMNPDKLRMEPKAVEFVRSFVNSGKPVASICHGPWLLVEADAVRGRKVTSYGSIKTDLINAGANWVDEECVVDQGIVTSRNPKDIPAFNKKMIEEFAEGKHQRQAA